MSASRWGDQDVPSGPLGGKGWHQLIELYALSGAVLADPDGVYDPADYNDRLALRLRGTICEAELHLIKQLMWNGRVNRARRSEFTFTLPSGYIRRPSGEVVFDPDEQVQTVTSGTPPRHKVAGRSSCARVDQQHH